MGRKKKKRASQAGKNNDTTSKAPNCKASSTSSVERKNGEPTLSGQTVLGTAERDKDVERGPFNLKRFPSRNERYDFDFPPLSSTQRPINQTGVYEASIPRLETEKNLAHEPNSLAKDEEGAVGYNSEWPLQNTKNTLEEDATGGKGNAAGVYEASIPGLETEKKTNSLAKDAEHLEGVVGNNSEWHLPNTRKAFEDDATGGKSIAAVNVSQVVSGVQANNVQIGNKNTMEITSDEDGGKLHHTTNIGGDHSLNVFGGQAHVRDISIQNSEDTCVEGSSVRQKNKIVNQATNGGQQVIKNFHAEHVEIKNIVNTQVQTKSPDETQPKSKHFESFNTAVRGFRDGHYILITDRTEHVKHIRAIGRVPWTAVFDFDVFSRRSGLLSHVEDILESRRCLNLYTWQDKCNITESSTSWVFMNGNDQTPDSVISECNAKEWKRKILVYLDSNVSQLSKFKMACTEFTVIVMWPQNPRNVHQITDLLTKLDDALDPTVIIVDDGHTKNEVSESTLKFWLTKSGPISCVQLSFEEVCIIISSIFPEQTQSKCDYKLPTFNKTNITDITDKQANFIAEDLEVLYNDNMTGKELTSEGLKQEEDNFYRGGTLPWSWWYQVGPNHADIERDIVPKITDFVIRNHIEVFKGGIITICHYPGSGGTTLAQRIIWNLKDKSPCAQVKSYTGSPPESVMEKVELIANKTNLPVILLMDGEEQNRVKMMEKRITDHGCLVILYVKRCSKKIKENVGKDNATFWLADSISGKEANVLALKYGKVDADKSKRKSVETMLSEVKVGKKHSLFEFGLEMHRHLYYGLETYVSGFLQYQKRGELKPYQKALGMLSLVYYYGQATVPSHFFSGIFETKRDRKVLMYEDFPEQMHGLVVKDELYGRRNGVRISHVLVAKEILDQILVRSMQKHRIQHKTPTISNDAKRNLLPFAKNFIQYAGKMDNGKSSLIKNIVTRTFISRDNKPLGEDETHNKSVKKPKISPILEDVSNTAPYTKRFEVLEQLTVSFPHEPQFHAHEGRLYTICKPEEYNKANDCFVKALHICKEQTNIKKMDDIPHTMKLTLMHIYHMYGNMFLLRVSQFTGRYFEDKPKMSIKEDQFKTTACILLKYTKDACSLFDQCREITPAGYEQSCNYISEISVRLMLCNFILKHGGSNTLHRFMENKENEEPLKIFLEESTEKLDELLIECLSVVDPEQMDENILSCNVWYSQLFKPERNRSIGLIERRFANKDENMHTRRMRIAIIKMNYSDGKSGILESVSKKDDIECIIQQYENNFSDENQILTKRQNDIDYREWLFAIRHRDYGTERSLEEVLTFVQEWYDRQKTPYARFYLFILKSLIGFGDKRFLSGNIQVLLESQRLKAEVTEYARFIAKPKYPREWLGHANANIRRLVPGKRFFGLFEYQDDNNDCEAMIGTICHPNNKPSSGYIDLDLGTTIPIAIKVFFVPARSDMKGGSNKYARVEFHLGFSMSHGYEAFNVKPLKSVKCELCGAKMEYRSCDTICYCTHEKCQGVYRPKRNGSGPKPPKN